MYSLWIYFMVKATNYLSIARALTFGNIQILFFQLYEVFKRRATITREQFYGIVAAVIGLGLLMIYVPDEGPSYDSAIKDLSMVRKSDHYFGIVLA